MSTQTFARACALAAGALCVTLPATAANPESGTLNSANPVLEFTTGPSLVSNPAYSGTCSEPESPCDDFTLTVEALANQSLKLHTVGGTPTDDYDVEVRDANGSVVATSGNAFTPEDLTLTLNAGTASYTVRLIPYLVAGSTATTTLTLVTDDAAGPGTGGGDAPVVVDVNPQNPANSARYVNYVSPPGEGNDSGEPTVGFNPLTERAMFISYVNALRVTFPENLDEPLPEACDALWENKSGLVTTLNSLDPIMYTDKTTGRTFNSQLSGANSLFEYSDDDGESWTPGQIGLPNGGADHQGVVSGPYPAGFPTAGLLFPNAVYYCSQSVAGAFCARSDDGGQTFGPGTPFKNPDCSAGALHGHPQVAPDGTLYIPDSSQCIASLGVDGSAEHVVAFVSEDAGTTYEVRPIPTSTGGAGSDPSVGIAKDGTVYMCYENGDGTTHVAVSKDKGLTWENDQDIGKAAGLVATRFPAAIAGDSDRAACAFLGTQTRGPDLELDFEGIWYPYVATTYDGGKTWDLVNVSPNDPVQGEGGVGTSGTNRNLLDFNDLEIDNFGRPLFAYADGCIGGCVLDPSQNSFAAKGTIARQSGGRTLYAEFDDLAGSQFNASSPIAPAPACASPKSTRTVNRTVVQWIAPDNGGSAITNYKVYRATAATGPYEFVGDAGDKTLFVDGTADVTVPEYFYKIVAENAVGAAADSNVLALPLSEEQIIDTCNLPGETIILDPAGDAPVSDYDVVALSVAEPEAFAGNLVVTLKIAGFSATEPPPSSYYPVLFPLLDSFYFALDVSEVTPRFVYGTFEELPQGLLAFTEDGELDSRSTYGADGTIVFVVPKALLGAETGKILAGFDVRTRLASESAPSRDTAGPADYLVRGHESCGAVQSLVLADLQASVKKGSAPLTVNYTISGTATEGNNLVSWSLDFGDGQLVNDQAFNAGGPTTMSHVYQSAGVYRALLTVTDSAGNTSTNLAEQTIEVAAQGAPVPGVDNGGNGNSNANTRGGAFGPWLMLLMLAGLARRRSR